jgi:hypothetical protein
MNGRRRPSDIFSGDTKSSAAFGCSKKIWTAAVSFPSGADRYLQDTFSFHMV